VLRSYTTAAATTRNRARGFSSSHHNTCHICSIGPRLEACKTRSYYVHNTILRGSEESGLCRPLRILIHLISGQPDSCLARAFLYEKVRNQRVESRHTRRLKAQRSWIGTEKRTYGRTNKRTNKQTNTWSLSSLNSPQIPPNPSALFCLSRPSILHTRRDFKALKQIELGTVQSLESTDTEVKLRTSCACDP